MDASTVSPSCTHAAELELRFFTSAQSTTSLFYKEQVRLHSQAIVCIQEAVALPLQQNKKQNPEKNAARSYRQGMRSEMGNPKLQHPAILSSSTSPATPQTVIAGNAKPSTGIPSQRRPQCDDTLQTAPFCSPMNPSPPSRKLSATIRVKKRRHSTRRYEFLH